jgi:small ligand-binding sensory domain FIST
VFKEDIGEVLARDLEKIAGYIFVGFPVPHTDTNDYLVRNIIGFDLDNSVIAIGELVEEGRSMMFCRRDGNSAIEDLQRMLQDISSRISTLPKGALYFSCIARGRNQFGEDSAELKIIQQHLGDVPLVGFFANGEILHNRLYGYTGVLTLFT